MLSAIVEALACPQCAGSLGLNGNIVRCDSGHSFDIARQGYVNLLPGRANASTADTAAMVAARHRFLEAGHFAPITDAVVSAARTAVPVEVPGLVLDAGAGTGYALASVLDAMPSRAGVALDISKFAARVAARSHPRTGAIVADVWNRVPLRDGCAALVLDIFSPRNAEEFARVLVSGGTLIVVTPNSEHLAQLVKPMDLITVDPLKAERLSASLGRRFELVTDRVVTYPLALSREDAAAAVSMGPSAAHLAPEEIERRIEVLDDPVTVTVSVRVGTYRSCPTGPA